MCPATVRRGSVLVSETRFLGKNCQTLVLIERTVPLKIKKSVFSNEGEALHPARAERIATANDMRTPPRASTAN